MKNVANFLLFQGFWFAAVLGAAEGSMWLGPAAVLVFLAIHLRMLNSPGDRRRELGYILAVGLTGAVADSVLHALGATVYPTSHAWPLPVVPPWIVSLWVGFAMLPRFSLGWLRGRLWLATLLGALGGPLSYLGGTRLEAVAVGPTPAWTWIALTVEYAVVTPLLLHWAPEAAREEQPVEAPRRAVA